MLKSIVEGIETTKEIVESEDNIGDFEDTVKKGFEITSTLRNGQYSLLSKQEKFRCVIKVVSINTIPWNDLEK